MAYQAGAYPSFCSMVQLGVFVLPPAWDASIVHCMATFGINFAGTHLYTWVERGTVRKSLECIAHEHNAMLPCQPGLEPGQLNLELSVLTVMPPRLHRLLAYKAFIY